jgi:hypothetical protein
MLMVQTEQERHQEKAQAALQSIRSQGDDPRLITVGAVKENADGTRRFMIHLSPYTGSVWSFCGCSIIPDRAQSRTLKQATDKWCRDLYCDECLKELRLPMNEFRGFLLL